MTGKSTTCLNLGSYNYLGFAQKEGPCADAAIEAVYKYGVGSPSTVRDLGELQSLHVVTMWLNNINEWRAVFMNIFLVLLLRAIE